LQLFRTGEGPDLSARSTFVAAAAATGLAIAGPASAATLVLGLNVEFSGGTAPAGSTPWITATFDDSFGGPNTVRLTLEATNLVGTENIKEWHFNFDPALDPTLLSFVAVSNAASVPNAINTGVNAFQADGDGKYDIQFDFPPPPGSFGPRFTAGETVIYDLTYVAPISASSFDFFSVPGGGQGTFLSAAHIQSIGEGEDSGWIGVVPEPGTASLLGLGLLGLALRRRAPRA
jgi:hypothetical protein